MTKSELAKMFAEATQLPATHAKEYLERLCLKPGTFASATEQVAQLAATRAKEQGISLGEAMKQVFGEQPGLYEQYVVESVATKAKGRE